MGQTFRKHKIVVLAEALQAEKANHIQNVIPAVKINCCHFQDGWYPM